MLLKAKCYKKLLTLGVLICELITLLLIFLLITGAFREMPGHNNRTQDTQSDYPHKFVL